MSDYSGAVERELAGLTHESIGAIAGCAECWDGFTDQDDDESRELAEEPGFSWASCDSCGSTFGGDRHPAHAVTSDGDIIHLDVCTDCVMYLGAGEEPEAWQRHPG